MMPHMSDPMKALVAIGIVLAAAFFAASFWYVGNLLVDLLYVMERRKRLQRLLNAENGYAPECEGDRRMI